MDGWGDTEQPYYGMCYHQEYMGNIADWSTSKISTHLHDGLCKLTNTRAVQ